MSRNPFRKNSEQFESVKGEDVLNVREETIAVFGLTLFIWCWVCWRLG